MRPWWILLLLLPGCANSEVDEPSEGPTDDTSPAMDGNETEPAPSLIDQLSACPSEPNGLDCNIDLFQHLGAAGDWACRGTADAGASRGSVDVVVDGEAYALRVTMVDGQPTDQRLIILVDGVRHHVAVNGDFVLPIATPEDDEVTVFIDGGQYTVTTNLSLEQDFELQAHAADDDLFQWVYHGQTDGGQDLFMPLLATVAAKPGKWDHAGPVMRNEYRESNGTDWARIDGVPGFWFEQTIELQEPDLLGRAPC